MSTDGTYWGMVGELPTILSPEAPMVAPVEILKIFRDKQLLTPYGKNKLD